MTAPRQILPGTTYLVTRRCFQREFLLKPSAATNAVFKFVLAVAAQRFGILLHAACVLSNHYHLVLTDPGAELPRFGQLLDGLIARALNASYGRWESFWAPSSYSAVTLVSTEDIVEKVAYTLSNPVAAALVSRAAEWPGVWSDPACIGAGGEVVPRPDLFFSKEGAMPERETLVFSCPPGFASIQAFRAEVISRVSEMEEAVAAELGSRGLPFMGAARVVKQSHTDTPAPGEPRRVLNPRVAARDKWKRIEALGRLVGFLVGYREALRRLRKREVGVVFPRGTYLLRVQFGVPCGAG